MPEMLKTVRYESSQPLSEDALEATGFAMLDALKADERLAAREIGPVLVFDYKCSAFELTFGGEVSSRGDALALLADVQRVLNRRLAELDDEHDDPPIALETAGDFVLT